MGGGTTLRFGYEHPERVHGLITMGSSSGGPTLMGAAGLTEGLKILQKGYRQPSFETVRELVDVMTFDSAFATHELIQSRVDMVWAHPEHTHNFIDGTGKKPVGQLNHARLRSMDVPVLLFHGRDHRVVNFEHSLRLTSLIPNSRLYLINGYGHWLQIEHATEFIDRFCTYSRRADPPRAPPRRIGNYGPDSYCESGPKASYWKVGNRLRYGTRQPPTVEPVRSETVAVREETRRHVPERHSDRVVTSRWVLGVDRTAPR